MSRLFEYAPQHYEPLRPHVVRTPVVVDDGINRELGAELFFKCENLQKTGSFKYRGAMNALLHLEAAERHRGVVTVSSGNHGAALARAGRELGIRVHVIVPENIAPSKLENIRRYEPDIAFSEPGAAGRHVALEAFRTQCDAIYIPPFNHIDIICGQASAAHELNQQVPDLDVVLVPIGGGGLGSGTCLAMAAGNPSARVIGVEPANADDAFRSLETGVLQEQPCPDTVCDGLRTALGDLTFAILRQHLQRIVLVTEQEILSAMKSLHRRLRMSIEPSSATVYAAILKDRAAFHGKKVGVMISGGNIANEEHRDGDA